MARFKPSGTHRTRRGRSNKGWIPCAILILAGFVLVFLLMYEVFKSGR
jgi:hypothetical protein